VISNLNNLVFFIKNKNEKKNMSNSTEKDSDYMGLNAYSEKIIKDLIVCFTKIKNKFSIFNFNQSSTDDNKFQSKNNNNHIQKFYLESNLNTNISKS